jgi:transcriptional regulator with XRE-family HTH domain
MSRIREIRDLLQVNQSQLGEALGCTQSNVGQIERGELVLMPDRALRLIDWAKRKKRVALTMDQVYGRDPLPAQKAKV